MSEFMVFLAISATAPEDAKIMNMLVFRFYTLKETMKKFDKEYETQRESKKRYDE